ncbi:saccharopine dehydrogenase C-terminal domain-containing protein [Virgibacillus halophilus]|uniref:Saccharopine dehydrogenase C-terminal domain-containing protein n=1 Tax=Tigheibacillus halophilus TaxID=361280 RepID=A0ABU5C8J4_9BACI|nr:saccharopine dehydrogenase C-terminal domain-containing protein [Virgibacillus halophilus]
MEKDAIEVDGKLISPVAFTQKILEPKLRGQSKEDITVLRVSVKGKKDGMKTRYTWEMVNNFDHERDITSMARTTAIPAMLTAQWIATGRLDERGVLPMEKIMIGKRFKPFMEELKGYGIEIEFQQERR